MKTEKFSILSDDTIISGNQVKLVLINTSNVNMKNAAKNFWNFYRSLHFII